MPFSSITLKPGVNTIATATLNQAGISDSNLIRHRMGLPEKLGGWIRYIQNAMVAIVRDLHAWQDLSSNKWLSVGTLTSLNAVGNASTTQTITPQTSTFSPAVNVSTLAGSRVVTIIDANITANITTNDSVFFNTPIAIGGITLSGLWPVSNSGSGTYQITVDFPAITTVANAGAVPSFATALGSNSVTVTFASHNLTANISSFVFPISTIVGGVTISGNYLVQSTPTADTFVIFVAATATAAATVSMNAGLAQYLYFFTLDSSGTASRLGPPGAIGQFPIGEVMSSVVTATSQTGTPITTTNWTSDNWGEILLSCAKGGPIFYWSPNAGFSTATAIGNGPRYNGGIFVAMPQQILVAWGSTTGSRSSVGGGSIRQDPLIVRWSDQLDFTNWIVSSRTQAGSFHIPNGSEIRGGLQASTQALIFTDIDVWGMQYLGYPLVFGFNSLGSECGLIGPHAAVDTRGATYWMNATNFFILDGRGVKVLPCTVWDDVFKDLDITNGYKCVAAKNSAFNEVAFYYPSTSGGSGECDKYAKYNISEGSWDKGSLRRSAWIDQTVLGNPIGADPSSLYLYQHELGYDNDGTAMDSWFETGYFAYGDGENFSVIDHFEPDMKWLVPNSTTSATVQITLSAVEYPNSTPRVNPVLTMTSTTSYLTPRLRGRQLKWRVESTDLNSFWRMGQVRYRYGIDGQR